MFRIRIQLNSDPDLAKILNPDQEDPWIRIRILAIFNTNLIIILNYYITNNYTILSSKEVYWKNDIGTGNAVKLKLFYGDFLTFYIFF